MSACPGCTGGKDIHWWMDMVGVSNERFDEVDDIIRARRFLPLSWSARLSARRSTSTS